jgi:hypothetical protein
MALGRMWQDTAGTIAATTTGHPVARVDVRSGTNWTQASTSLQPYLSPVGKVLGVRSDDIDDHLGNNTAFYAAGAKTFAVLFQKNSNPSSTGQETVVRLGYFPTQQCVVIGGLSATTPRGLAFRCDWNSTASTCIQDVNADTVMLPNGVHSLVITYDGVSATAPGSYAAWLNGSALTLKAGNNGSATGFERVLATSTASQVFDGAVAEVLLYDGVLSTANRSALIAYLEAKR